MKDKGKHVCRRWILVIVALAALGHDTLAWALEATISARYRGEAEGRFENTTPQASFCYRWPQNCQGVQTVGLPIEYTKTSISRAPDARDQFFVKLPSSRTVDVVNERGETHSLTFEITHVSQWVEGAPDVNPVFTSVANGGCQYKLTYGAAVLKRALYLWAVRNPSNPSACWSTGQRTSPGDSIDSQVKDMGIAYSLKMPPPFKMKQGIYRGRMDFSVGPGADFDFGNGVTDLNDTSLTLNFELDVQHAFVMQFPPGSERAVLEPPGGWQAWLGGRAAPPRLERDLPFRLWSTGPFKVYKKCSVQLGGGQCGISNRDFDALAVEVAIDLPPEVRYQGNPVRRLNVPTGVRSALGFEHMMPASNRPANLHFEVSGPELDWLLKSPGETYEGVFTLVFESDL